MKRKQIIIIYLMLLGSGSLHAQEQLSLGQAISRALENNYQIRIGDLNVEIARTNNAWGAVGAYPGINIGATNVNRFDDNSQGKSTTNSLSPNVSMNWMIFNGFSARINKEKLEKLENLSEGNSRLVVENTLQAVVLGYYQVLLEKEKMKVLEKVMALSRDRYEYEQTRKELGNALTFDVLQAQNAYLNDSSNYIRQKTNYHNALRNLNQLMAVEVGSEFTLTGDFKPEYEAYELDSLEQKMLADNRNLRNQYINLEIMKKNVGIEKSALYPSLSLNSGYDYNTTRVDPNQGSVNTSDSYGYYANFSLSFNLFNGGNTRRNIKNARIDKRIAEVETRELKNQLRRNLRTTYEFYKVRKQLLDVSLENIESAELNLRIAEDKFKAGTINSFNYRDIQMTYLNAALSRVEAIYSLIDTHTQLMRLTGGIISEY
ncbi:MAG: TolC family protein [Bacteroidales bacterium]|nr:TolC family protein [Bacteroidales bacterium]